MSLTKDLFYFIFFFFCRSKDKSHRAASRPEGAYRSTRTKRAFVPATESSSSPPVAHRENEIVGGKASRAMGKKTDSPPVRLGGKLGVGGKEGDTRVGWLLWCRGVTLVVLLVSFLAAIFYASSRVRFVEDVLPQISGTRRLSCTPRAHPDDPITLFLLFCFFVLPARVMSDGQNVDYSTSTQYGTLS